MSENRKISKLKKSLSFTLFARFMAVLTIFTVILVFLFLAVLFVGSSITWEQGSLYRFLKSIKDNIIIIGILIWAIGFIIIFFRYWSKPVNYIEDILEASGQLIKDNDNLVQLPVEIKEVEHQFNLIKTDFRKSRQAAKEAEQRKNDLIVYLAHDLKTPLTSVIGYLTLLRDEQEISEELRHKYVNISLDKAERLEQLINEFFEITRFNLTNLTLELSTVNLTIMLRQIIFEFNPVFAQKNLQCEFNSENDITIKCDVEKMERVFDNLIRNAINYSFDGSTVKIEVIKNFEGVVIKFINRGNTIPEEKLSRIFEQFYRLDSARTSNTGGVGLGLAISKEIIELHKGTIKAYSSNEEIKFEIILPEIL